ncbi:MAG: PIN domain-containing protein [Pseudomonadota bacterium]
MPNAFLDTNVIIYAATGKKNEPEKQAVAQRLLEEEDFGISVQTLNEFYSNMRKPKFSMPIDTINQWIANLLEFDCTVVDTDIFFTASRLSERFEIPYYDAALLAAAKRHGAVIFFTEDLNHGQDYDGVQVINPFM